MTEIDARPAPLVAFGDSSSPARPITKVPFDFVPVSEVQPDLRQGRSVAIQLQPITVSPMQMRALRERRIAARDLGWVIPGHRIRIQS